MRVGLWHRAHRCVWLVALAWAKCVRDDGLRIKGVQHSTRRQWRAKVGSSGSALDEPSGWMPDLTIDERI